MGDNLSFLYFFIAAGLLWLLYKLIIEPAWRDDDQEYTKKRSFFGSWRLFFKDMPYEVINRVMTSNEIQFYRELKEYIGDKALIFPKMALKEIFKVDDGIGNWGKYFSKISQKHVDFSLVDPNSMKILCAIELDDSSHLKAKAIKNDEFKNDIFEITGIPLIRFTTMESITKEKLDKRIGKYIGILPGETKAPICNQCGTKMTLIQMTSGEDKGKYYWICNNYPDCKSVRDVAV